MKETECGAVKIEGGRRMAETIRYLVDRGIPVMAHIGLTPQSVNVIGGFKAQGRSATVGGNRGRCARSWPRPAPLPSCSKRSPSHWRRRSPQPIPIPTIGIGAWRRLRRPDPRHGGHAGPQPRVPKFVKEFGNVGAVIEGAIRSYAGEVRARTFPAPEHTYAMKRADVPQAANPSRVTKKTKTATS